MLSLLTIIYITYNAILMFDTDEDFMEFEIIVLEDEPTLESRLARLKEFIKIKREVWKDGGWYRVFSDDILIPNLYDKWLLLSLIIASLLILIVCILELIVLFLDPENNRTHIDCYIFKLPMKYVYFFVKCVWSVVIIAVTISCSLHLVRLFGLF